MYSRLRQVIRKIILEAYEMTPEDEAGLEPYGIQKGGSIAQAAKKDKNLERVCWGDSY